MTALDFMMACVGAGVLLVCIAWSVKILSDARSRTRLARDSVQKREEPLDPLGKQLHEFRNARFGREMTSPRPPGPAETWPVMRPRAAVPPPTDDKRKKDPKERGGK